MKRIQKPLIILLAAVVFTAMAFGGCSSSRQNAGEAQTAARAEGGQLGEGSTAFTFIVTDQDSNQLVFDVFTDKTTVGEALAELEMIAGEQSEYGLYVKEVNGIYADYNENGFYWAFYIDGEYASAGVDSTEISAGAVYELRLEKA